MSDSMTPANSSAADEERRLAALRQEETQRREATDKAEATRRETIQKQQDEALRAAKANADRQVEQAREMQAQHEQQTTLRQAYLNGLEREAEQARQVKDWTEKREREEAARPKDRPIFINDAGARYAQALGANYNVRDPYGSMASAAMAEYGSFVRDREALSKEISKTDDPKERRALELRQQIELCDYMTITSNRIAAQSAVITGRMDSREGVAQREQAERYQTEGKALREQLREHVAGREAARPEAARPEAQKSDPMKEMAAEARGTPEPKAYKQAELASDPVARARNNAQQLAGEERGAALDRMNAALKDNKAPAKADFEKLRQSDLEGLRKDGTKHFRQMMAEREKERSATNEAGRGRERERER